MKSYDLHSHSTASDGTLSPSALLTRAKQYGVDVMALTDHDTLKGLHEARTAALNVGIEFVPGVEISTTWRERTIHIVGLAIDPADTTLNQGLAALQFTREQRAQEMARRLEKNGVPGITDWLQTQTTKDNLTRTHFARYVVQCGKAASVADVFKRYLSAGKPGYVKTHWASLDEAIDWINAAGGRAVVAHPSRYNLTATKMRELLGDFIDVGGLGIEVAYAGCDANTIHHNATLARRFGLLASVGSDFHSPDLPWTQLGRQPRLPGDLTPIWHDGLTCRHELGRAV